LVIVPDDGYKTWLPQGDIKNPTRPGNELGFAAKLIAEDGKEVRSKENRFVFELEKTSSEPGVCMNWPGPGAPAEDKPDLRFDPRAAPASFVMDAERGGQTALTIPGPQTSATGTVSCYDYGAYGQLKVHAVLANGRKVYGHLVNEKSRTRVLIPYRENDSTKVAQEYKKSHAVPEAKDADDEDAPSAAKATGDGFTLYEEYRGFCEDATHLRCDPKKVDLFVRNYIGSDAVAGIELFADITGAQVHHRLRDEEFDKTKRVMNANHGQGAHLVDQHGIYLYTDAGLNGAATHLSKAGVRGRPVITLGIAVQPRDAATTTMTNQNAPASDAIFAYDRAIAHEMLHAVGAEHHGRGDYHMSLFFVFSDDPQNTAGKAVFRDMGGQVSSVTDEASGRDLAAKLEPDLMLARERWRAVLFPPVQARVTELLKDRKGIDLKYTPEQLAQILYNQQFGQHYWYVGVQQGECSGDEPCIMRYSFAEAYEKKGTPRAYYFISEKHSERAGLELCRSAAGTGVNDAGRKPQPRYGAASPGWGPCAGRIIFSDAIALERAP
jgi:hypothetical protein